MKITIIHAHWNNRGDEAALRAFVDELLDYYPNAEINIGVVASKVLQFPYEEDRIHLYNDSFPKKKNKLDYWLTYLTRGKICLFENTRKFVNFVKNSDIVLHAPGGPSIGDIYYGVEDKYLKRLDLIRRMGIKYAFYAPSMGPFKSTDRKRIALRKRVLNGAEFIYLREQQSADFVDQFGVENKNIFVSLDSAFQHYGDNEKYKQQYDEYKELCEFMKSYNKVVGVTITDLIWHPIHGKDECVKQTIRDSFTRFISYLKERNIGVVFIPQTFGTHNDRDLMLTFADSNCFAVDDYHDTYFQQYLIGKLHAVIGMRYHSNIFSAKMGTPFVSVAYEQKMSGFMEISGLSDYCIDVRNLSAEELIQKYEKLESHYDEYRLLLEEKKDLWKEAAHKTTDAVIELLDRK